MSNDTRKKNILQIHIHKIGLYHSFPFSSFSLPSKFNLNYLYFVRNKTSASIISFTYIIQLHKQQDIAVRAIERIYLYKLGVSSAEDRPPQIHKKIPAVNHIKKKVIYSKFEEFHKWLQSARQVGASLATL